MADPQIEKLLDSTGRAILLLLQEDARISYAEVGRRVSLSTPAVIERIGKMEACGLITGCHAHIDERMLGYSVEAVVMLTTQPRYYDAVQRIVSQSVEIDSCDHVTGPTSFIMKLKAHSIDHLELITGRFAAVGTTETALVLSSLDTSGVTRRRIVADTISDDDTG